MDSLNTCIICLKNYTQDNYLCENCLKIDLELDLNLNENWENDFCIICLKKEEVLTNDLCDECLNIDWDL